MEKFFDYISDAAIKCKIIKKDDSNKNDLQITHANKHTEYITNLSNDEIINKNISDIFPKMTDTLFNWPKIFIETAMTNDSKIIEQYFVPFEKYLRFNIFGYEDDCFDIIITDLTEKKEIKRQLLVRDRQIRHLENEIKSSANVDMLTKLYNFQFIVDSIANSIENYNEDGDKFCLLLLDIDNFKKINELHGIKAGDEVLQKASLLFSSIARKIDVTGRYGKDEFIIIFNNLDIDITKIMVEKLKKDIEKHFIKSIDSKISVSGALLEYSGEPLEQLLNKLEKSVIKAKSLGNGTIIS
jgi:diguanylate cyclase (GGDEF)-like protein